MNLEVGSIVGYKNPHHEGDPEQAVIREVYLNDKNQVAHVDLFVIDRERPVNSVPVDQLSD